MTSLDFLVFDYGHSPRGPLEESLGGDMSRTLALAHVLRERLARETGREFSEPAISEVEVVMWFDESVARALRSIVLEPVPGAPFTWAIRLEEHRGLLGVYFPRQPDPVAFGPIREGLQAVLSNGTDEFRNVRWMTKAQFQELG